MRKFEYRGEKVILLLPPENWFSKFPVPVRNPFQRPEPVYPDPVQVIEIIRKQKNLSPLLSVICIFPIFSIFALFCPFSV
ncbi:MAG: hypothetical protein ACLUPA_16640, partial [Phocaeicola massiliensis]